MFKKVVHFCCNSAAKRGLSRHCKETKMPKHALKAFSLVEMLMALLVASLLLAALAPVITRKMNENMTISVEGTIPGKKVRTHNITYEDCINSGGSLKTDASNGSQYCEGEFVVPTGFNGTMTVTVVGAGGGGGAAATAGYTEYTTAGSTNTFTVPLMVNNIEATLISGGAGGGAGGQVKKTQTFVTSGNGGITNKTDNDTITEKTDGTGTWNIPDAVRNKNVIASACGGGGGGGSSAGNYVNTAIASSGYGGGSGGYILNKVLNFSNATSLSYYVGGGGAGGGAAYGPTDINALSSGGGGGGCYSYPEGNGGQPPEGCSTSKPAGSGGPAASSLAGRGGEGFPASYGTTTGYPYGGAGGTQGGGSGSVIHFSGCANGGGGGGGGASQILIGTGIYLDAPGGGGGSGFQRSAAAGTCPAGTVAGGGGGGGVGGGNGGGKNNNGGKGGKNGGSATGTSGAVVSTIFGSSYCGGGNGGSLSLDSSKKATHISPTTGKSGAIRLTYLDYGTGASGGGGGNIVPIQQVNVQSNETLNVNIANTSTGKKSGYIDNSGTINYAKNPWEREAANFGQATNIARGTNVILKTSNDSGYAAQPGCPSGTITNTVGEWYCGHLGWIHNGKNFQLVNFDSFSNTHGHNAGDSDGAKTITIGGTYANGTTGGAGGKVTTPWFSCTPGKGGTKSNPKGGDATGYGCGGGGGYGLADGGNGSGGYARISWNKYWNTENNDYDFNNVGAGGGGASGNVMKFNIAVKSGERIKYRVGKGGSGAYIVTTSSASVVEATKGGDTIFAYGTSRAIKAGGGGKGSTPKISDDNTVLINGIGGSSSDVCHLNNTSRIDTSDCKRGSTGGHAIQNKGGDGTGISEYGTGGKAKAAGRGDTNGGNGTGYGAGGAGASLRDLDLVNPSESATNPTQGGDGTNGVIMLRWEE